MAEKELMKKKVLAQSPAHGAHLRLPEDIQQLEKHIAHFRACGDENEANAYAERLKHAKVRLSVAARAAALVDQFGLKHDIAPGEITYNDAVNFVAKTMHECVHGVASSNYTRANHSDANDGAHIDPAQHGVRRDPAVEVVEHLGLVDPAHIAAVNALFGKAE